MSKPLVQYTWSDVSYGLGRNDFPVALANAILEHQISGTELAKGIVATWVTAEWPAQQIEIESWSIIFGMVIEHDEFLTDDGKVLKYDELPESITLYRGAIPEFAFGMSWTTDRTQADWFAHRLEPNRSGLVGKVYTITIPREFVIGRFSERREQEYVVDVTRLNGEDEMTEVKRR